LKIERSSEEYHASVSAIVNWDH